MAFSEDLSPFLANAYPDDENDVFEQAVLALVLTAPLVGVAVNVEAKFLVAGELELALLDALRMVPTVRVFALIPDDDEVLLGCLDVADSFFAAKFLLLDI
jgi:hypothetical protein